MRGQAAATGEGCERPEANGEWRHGAWGLISAAPLFRRRLGTFYSVRVLHRLGSRHPAFGLRTAALAGRCHFTEAACRRQPSRPTSGPHWRRVGCRNSPLKESLTLHRWLLPVRSRSARRENFPQRGHFSQTSKTVDERCFFGAEAPKLHDTRAGRAPKETEALGVG